MCCIKGIEILTENKPTCPQVQQVLRDQGGLGVAGFNCCLFPIQHCESSCIQEQLSQAQIHKECGLDTMGLIVFNKNLITNSQITNSQIMQLINTIDLAK